MSSPRKRGTMWIPACLGVSDFCSSSGGRSGSGRTCVSRDSDGVPETSNRYGTELG